MPRSTQTRQSPPGGRFQTDTNWPKRSGRAGSVLLLMRQGPVDKPISPEADTSTNAGRQSSTIGGSGLRAISAGPSTGPFLKRVAPGASHERKAARMPSRTDWAAKSVSAAASSAGESAGVWEEGVTQPAITRASGARVLMTGDCAPDRGRPA